MGGKHTADANRYKWGAIQSTEKLWQLKGRVIYLHHLSLLGFWFLVLEERQVGSLLTCRIIQGNYASTRSKQVFDLM